MNLHPGRLTFILLMFISLNTLHAAYPEKPITIVVHSKPGSGIDITSRQLANIARKYTKATILVENKTGGSGIVAMRYVLSKKADGYTILAVTKSFISTVLLTKGGVKMSDFDFLACMVVDLEVLITNRHSSVRTLEDIIRDARKKKGHQRWLGPLVGGVDHLMAVETWDKLGIKGEWIPYEGGADALAALMGKHGVVYVGNPVDVKGRPDLMIAAVAAPQRLPAFPEAPTFLEKGYDLKSEVLWRGYALKKGTDPEAVRYLTDLFRKISQDEEWLRFIHNTSAQPVFIGHDEFTAMVQTNQQKAIKYLRMAGILSNAQSGGSRHRLLVAGLFFIGLLVSLGIIYRLKRAAISGDSVIALVLIFLSGYLYYLTLDFPAGKLAQTVGPASMPRLWIYGLFIFCLWLLIDKMRSPGQVDDSKRNNLKNPLGLIALMVAYLLVMDKVGYILSTFVFLISGSYLMSYRRHWIIFVAVSGFVILSYFAFYKVLQVPLPRGVLFE